MMHHPLPLDLAGGIGLLAAALVQATSEPVPVPESVGGWVIFILVSLGFGGVILWAVRRALEDYFSRQQEDREQEKAERDGHRALTEQHMESLRDEVNRIATQRDTLIGEVIKDLRADRDFYRTAFMEERRLHDACRVQLNPRSDAT